jgi:tetratricopeptide (TPR) repeat protein
MGQLNGGLRFSCSGHNFFGLFARVILLLATLAAIPASASDDFRDISIITQAVNKALETQKDGATSSWSNPDSGNSGKINVTETFRGEDGRTCRNYRRATESAGVAKWTIEGIGCRKRNGVWELQEGAAAVAKARRQERASPLPPGFGSLVTEVEVPPLRRPLTFEEESKLSEDYGALRIAGRYREAIPIAKQLIANAETRGQADAAPHIQADAAPYIYNLAGTYLKLGRYELAERHYKRSLEIWDKYDAWLAAC